ncbi:restriction endonuclease [Alcaligenes aquatilis]|uniref:restriction endonuclease n=1 Tax=Alcaligenes aquatilis TaxID=323284 RepID=UPI003D253056
MSMELWLNRAGANGEYEDKFLDEGRIYLTWEGLNTDLDAPKTRDDLMNLLKEIYPASKNSRLINHGGQIWAFAKAMQIADWIVLPSKKQPVVYIGKIVGPYTFSADGSSPFFHYREVQWFGREIPKASFGQDLLYSFGAFMTVCRIRRNDALSRVQYMSQNGWKPETIASVKKLTGISISDAEGDTDDTGAEVDIVAYARQQVVRQIELKFKGHALTSLIAAILRAQGYTTWQSPEGADGGADILASSGDMGFGAERICVEVKSGVGTTDRPTVDKLLGAVTKFNANQGLFVAWGGFKQNVQKELASSFFKLRLWTQDDVLNALFSVYDHLDEDVKAMIPLQRTWTVVLADE